MLIKNVKDIETGERKEGRVGMKLVVGVEETEVRGRCEDEDEVPRPR